MLFEFEAPEKMMPEEVRRKLSLLLEKQILPLVNQPGPAPIRLTIAMLAGVEKEPLSHSVYELLSVYASITSILIKGVGTLFSAIADLLPKHFKDVSHQLDLVEECIRKMCTLLKCSRQFLNLELVNQMTIAADSTIEEKKKFCQSLAAEKGRYRIEHSDRVKKTMRDQYGILEQRIDTFLSKLPSTGL